MQRVRAFPEPTVGPLRPRHGVRGGSGFRRLVGRPRPGESRVSGLSRPHASPAGARRPLADRLPAAANSPADEPFAPGAPDAPLRPLSCRRGAERAKRGPLDPAGGAVSAVSRRPHRSRASLHRRSVRVLSRRLRRRAAGVCADLGLPDGPAPFLAPHPRRRWHAVRRLPPGRRPSDRRGSAPSAADAPVLRVPRPPGPRPERASALDLRDVPLDSSRRYAAHSLAGGYHEPPELALRCAP